MVRYTAFELKEIWPSLDRYSEFSVRVTMRHLSKQIVAFYANLCLSERR